MQLYLANDRTVNEVEQHNKAATNVEFVLWLVQSKIPIIVLFQNEGINTKKQIMTLIGA
jgi:hypothetical protein